mmetsp:Transcript_28872/g.93965  ORF Transcript_28872/g.93965 Transcript_28872/m.93965 type:complete len:208 (+) Transcript_28872:807-1430(+)
MERRAPLGSAAPAAPPAPASASSTRPHASCRRSRHLVTKRPQMGSVRAHFRLSLVCRSTSAASASAATRGEAANSSTSHSASMPATASTSSTQPSLRLKGRYREPSWSPTLRMSASRHLKPASDMVDTSSASPPHSSVLNTCVMVSSSSTTPGAALAAVSVSSGTAARRSHRKKTLDSSVHWPPGTSARHSVSTSLACSVSSEWRST